VALSFTSTESEDPDERASGSRLPHLPRLPSIPATPALAVVIAVTALILAAAGWYIATGETPLAVLKRLTTSPSFSMALPPPPGAAPAAAPSKSVSTESKPTGDATAGAMLSPPPAEKAEPVPPAPPPAPAKGVMPAAPAVEMAAPPPPANGAIPAGPSPVKPIPLQKAAEVPAPPPPPSPSPSAAAPPTETAAANPMSQTTVPNAEASAPSAPAASTAMSVAAPASAAAEPAQKTAMAAPPPPPAMNEPLAPPGGEPLAPPSFAQLPARTDLKPLPAAPVPDLLKDSPDGPLPVVDGGKEPRTAYARPFVPGKEKQAKIAVVVVGLGVSREAAEAAIAKLPPEIDLSFSPYAGNLDAWVKKARAAGHEVLLDLPLEPPNFPLHDAGPLAILAHDGPNAAVERLHQTLGKTTSYVGVAAALHSPVAAGEQWAPVLRELKSRGLLLLGDPLTGTAGDVPAAAPVALVPDETPFRAAIDAELARLLATAQRDGSAIAYVSPRPVTFERLLAWAVTLPQKGAVLAPASALVQTQP
jgi:polysaccharide deacetylase 2 family uncharacterized protein YibQ